MATFTVRSVDDIFQSILTEKQNYSTLDALATNGVSNEQTFLDALSSDSKVSIWLLWTYLTARIQWATDNVMLSQVTELEEIRDSSFIGNKDWYAYIAGLWQYGDSLVIDPTTFQIKYDIVDESKKLIGSVAVEEVGGKLLLKIRGKNTNLLSEDELSSFVTYMNKIKFAGTNLIIRNSESDKLKVYADVIYNGEAELSTVKSDVESAINAYIGTLNYQSTFNTNKLIDAVQAVDGVNDFQINTLEGRTDSGNFSTIVHTYKADAGYMEIDTNFPLSSSLTYKIG